MKKTLLFFCFAVVLSKSFSQTKTWNGPSGGSWSTGANWLPTGMPAATDTVIFNSANACDLDISPIIAALRATGVGGNILSSGGIESMTIGNNGLVPSVLSVASGSNLTIGNGGFGISFSTYGTGGANTAQIAGSLNLLFASSWIPCNAGITNVTNTDITGQINVTSIHTGAAITNSSTGTLRFLAGSSLLWSRNGGTIPTADYQDGSIINVTGVTTTMTTFVGSTNYNGLLIWNCASQNASVLGAAAVLLPTATYPMDSIRVLSTGSGTLRLATDPNSYTIGHLEVQGGTLEMSSAITSPPRTANITTDLKITGGTVLLNATYSGEVAGNAAGMRLTVNRDIIITGGTLNLTNRIITGTLGAGQILAYRHILQSGGLITASSTFAAQNYISMDGGGVQNLEMDNVTGQVALVVTNNTSGANLQDNIVLPHALNFSGGFISFNNFNISVNYGLLNSSAGGKAVTNGTGSLIALSMPANASKLFPVAPSSSTYNALNILTQASAVTNDYSVRVETGNNPAGIYNSTRTINRTWYIGSTSSITSGTVELTFQYAGTDANASCLPAANMELGHFIPGAPGAWSIDPLGSVTPSGSYSAGPFTPATLGGSSFVIGNVGSILAFGKTIDLTAQIQNNKANLEWIIDNTADIKTLEVERAADGRNFIKLAEVNTAVRQYQDAALLAGLNYYRVKLTDRNGKVTYSAIAAVLNKESGFDIVGLYPAVVNSNAVVNVTAAQKTKLSVLVTDMSGRQVQKILYNLVAGSNQFTVNLAGLSAGTYQLTGYIEEGISKTVRFVKQ
ncbi:hypothetical protein [Ferruginibacter sp.]